jgi:hypothetical protein
MILPAANCGLQLSLGSRIRRAGCRDHRSRDKTECFREQINAPGRCDNKKHGDTVHSRFAGQELDLICNHNFV